ncbi:MAG: N-methyl-L-tryptophan oxidase [Thermorudis peleae]|nr:N-methyl-L-tryptophan oxidase [Thermorudis peleae]
MSERYDVIVVGLGVMGAATAWQLAKRGRRVLGLEQFARGHDRGSSHGRTRIIRAAYYESPAYVPLVRRAFTLWNELAAEAGKPLFLRTGGLYLGQPASELVAGSRQSAETHGIAHELLDAQELMARFPALRVPYEMVGLYEPDAGLLYADECVGALLDCAAQHGATLRFNEPVFRWQADGAGIRVETAQGQYSADRLVLTAGAWIGHLLAELGLPLTIWRILHVHFAPEGDDGRFDAGHLPFVLWQDDSGIYSAFPALPGQGVKFGRHDTGEPCTAETVRRTVTDEEVDDLRYQLNRYLPGAGGSVLWSLTCLYTMTPDHHFIIDRHPAYPQVIYASPCSGHGFKFASAIGEILADLATEGTTSHDIALFAAARLGIGANA